MLLHLLLGKVESVFEIPQPVVASHYTFHSMTFRFCIHPLLRCNLHRQVGKLHVNKYHDSKIEAGFSVHIAHGVDRIPLPAYHKWLKWQTFGSSSTSSSIETSKSQRESRPTRFTFRFFLLDMLALDHLPRCSP